MDKTLSKGKKKETMSNYATSSIWFWVRKQSRKTEAGQPLNIANKGRDLQGCASKGKED